MKGWWTLEWTGPSDLTNDTKNHIANLIQDGFTEGEIIQDKEEEDREDYVHY